ncbi:hypothetical protein [Bythopirellula polymerisocia]|uniref:Uncharacterized protein n=1 Tax=Bythopirellula polymerisocia TaxID=2528003 RepID=A0A5C6D1H4_9BACT|nr:hypothetical protein [Bythopirellula polymerisocia]TWU30045.1 hypothetical protein Pla144_08310 [Bythopirellula polymerisocia]
MATRANVSPNYLVRLGIVGVVCVFGGLWFLYDGLVGYPAKRERGLDRIEFFEEHKDDLDDKGNKLGELQLSESWKKRAAEKGWPTDNPLNPETGKPLAVVDINEQFFYAGGAGLIGLGFLSRLVFMLGRWVESDGKQLRTKGGQQAKFSQITSLDKKKWQAKGIAFVTYQGEGGKGKIRLDDYYYNRPAMQVILREIEAAIDPAKIINGKPEPPEKTAIDMDANP